MSYLNDFMERMYEAPANGQCGYRYTSTGLVMLHVTSAIQTDEDAIAYVQTVNHWYPKTQVMLIEKRDAGQQNWRLIHRVEEAIGQLHLLPAEPVHVPAVEEVPAPVTDDDGVSVECTSPHAVVISVPPIPRPSD
jgi:hypothetical protein